MSETPRCQPCFESYVHRTFKTALGRINGGGRRTLAVGISGGESSATAAILLYHYYRGLSPNPFVTPAKIVLIHVTSGTERDNSCNQKHIQAIHDAIPNSELIITNLDPATLHQIDRVADPSDRHRLSKLELMKTLAGAAISARAEGVILGTSATRAVANILESVASGRGTAVNDDARAEMVTNGIRFLQPLKGLPIRVLVRFARLNLADVPFSNDAVPPRSLPSVIERFVCTAAEDNPSSVHNIVRVAERLGENDGPQCVLCGNVVSFPNCVSSDSSAHCDNTEFRGNGDENKSPRIVCYGCRGCVDRAGGRQSPDNAVLELIKQEEMRKQIEDFLL